MPPAKSFHSARQLGLLATTIVAVLSVGLLSGLTAQDSSAAPTLDPSVVLVDAQPIAVEAQAAAEPVTAELAEAAPVAAPAVSAQPAAVAAPAPVTQFDAEAQTWAVVVGANDYHGHEIDLAGAIPDAMATVDALEVGFGVDHGRRKVLLGDDMTAATVTDAIAWLVANAGPNDNAVFSYAGHVRTDGGARQAMSFPDGSLLTDIELAEMLSGLQAGAAWFPIAGCYSAGFDEILAPGRILTAASAATELSYENDAFGKSYLAQYVMVEGILGGNATTVEAAVAYANERLTAEFPNRTLHQFDLVDGDFRRI